MRIPERDRDVTHGVETANIEIPKNKKRYDRSV